MIQPGTAALCGLLFATVMLHEPLLARRVIGALAIVTGSLLLGGEALATIGAHGLLGDLSFLLAGVFWAGFGTVLRLWNIRAQRAAVVISALSLFLYTPLMFFFGFDRMIAAGLWENALQAAVQGGLAGALAIHLFARAVMLLGAGRASAFPGHGAACDLADRLHRARRGAESGATLGLAVIAVGFRFTLKP